MTESQPVFDDDAQRADVRRAVIDWLDDNHHFGEAEALIQTDEQSFLENDILDSLGFVQLILFLENRYAIKIDRRSLRPANFDSLAKIVTYVLGHPEFGR